ncbi:hypothetical protein NUU61_005660 [Penicillium alfredii]|uniref:Uncharacterized protein n=1 Tax=Penicillium alfredii TaxID=1506179 RepID=A0A9W9FA97_9EURO|nr:uncharacterized protein NUU61_005660 [Penicillium alfredii]KAJ5096304.1 hypothetical protein NUU61_005660 [Penicillium alfredii]
MSDIHKLVAQYFQLVDPQHLALPDGAVLVQPSVQTALYERMFNESTLSPLPPANYRERVLKLILSRMENSLKDPEEDEIQDDLMNSWSSLVAQPKASALEQAQKLSHIKYIAPTSAGELNDPERSVITSESRGLILSAGTTGFRTWEAALHQASFLASAVGEALVHGKRVLELGAGTGLVSLFCARYLGVQSVVATDRELALIDNMRACVSLNQSGASLPIYPAVWEWGTPLDTTGDLAELVSDAGLQFDVALGADLVYDADLVPLLLKTVRDLFENYGVEHFIISATLRNEDTFRTFLTGCETNSFAVDMLPFESAPTEDQTGFFHTTSIPIRTYCISRSMSGAH